MARHRPGNVVASTDLTESDSDRDTIVVSSKKLKRKASNLESQRAKKRSITTASGRQSRLTFNARGTIDLTLSDGEDFAERPAPKPRLKTSTRATTTKSATATKPATTRKLAAAPHARTALRELSESEWNRGLESRLYVKLPGYYKGDTLRPQTSNKRAVSHHTNAAQDRMANGTKPLPKSRPRRHSARGSDAMDVSMRDMSEDELLDTAPPTPRKRASLRSRRSSNRRQYMSDSEMSDFRPEEEDSHTDSDFATDEEVNESSEGSLEATDASEEEYGRNNWKKKSSEKKVKPRPTVFLKSRDDSASASKLKAGTGSSKKATQMHNLIDMKRSKEGLRRSLPPLFEISDIFDDLTRNALELGLDKALKRLHRRPLRVATMCSGTESPLLALDMIRESLKGSSKLGIEIEHLFSAEIVPFKQAYIERNFKPPIIFRDITELTQAVKESEPQATTAYGAKVAIPTDVDMVIAGTSCVDFSRLNSRQKGLGDGGESADTWNAVLSFVQAFRPAFVLLENVKGACWDNMLADYRAIGYDSAGAYLDTKDFYLPQTRQRGYMVCYDVRKVNILGAADSWASLMEKLQRPASAPVSSFLLPSDQLTRTRFLDDEPVREVDWSQCEIRHIFIRQNSGLGNARPLTNWSESGAILPPDNGNHAWYARQVERVKDTIDCAALRKAKPGDGMFDVRFKTRVWDLSQNIDRETDSRPFGIVGCITPSGMFFVSDAGRLITSIELMKLQGLPLDKISFTTETRLEIQDLAGNAMSTTVIGASILASLIAGYKLLEPRVSESEPVNEHSECAGLSTGLLQLADSPSAASASTIDMATLIELAQQTQRRCHCEGHAGSADWIQKCIDCDHTTCIVCGGNPAHNYRPDKSARAPPRDFETYVRSILPLWMHISDGSEVSGLLPRAQGSQNVYREAVQEAFAAEFRFHRIRRTHCWTISYRAETASGGAVLNLVLLDGRAEWQLYALPSKSAASDDQTRQMLLQPIGKSDARHSFYGDSWVLRAPNEKTMVVSIQGGGNHIAAYWNRHQMPEYSDHLLWEYLEITGPLEGKKSELHGRYRYLPNCGTAFDGLYRKVDNKGAEPIYFFLAPTRIESPAQDCYVFSTEKELLEYDETSPVLGRLTPSWRPWSDKKKPVVISRKTSARLQVDSSWQSLPAKFNLQASLTKLDVFRNSVESIRNIGTDCTKAVVLADCSIPLAYFGETDGTCTHSDAKFFDQYAWAFESMRKGLPSTQWNEMSSCDVHCEACAPTRPELRWRLENGTVVPYEEPQGAAHYERAIKSRPTPMVVQTKPDGTAVHLSLGVNLISLVHRARARLVRSMAEFASPLTFAWRFDTLSAPDFVLKPFQLHETRGIEPFTSDIDGLTVNLFPNQQLALAWMRNQEQGVEFVLEESEEAELASLGWRTEVRARSIITVRGGICADHPGFGKTITSLALIQAQLNDNSRAEIVRDIKERHGSDLIAVQATLIICPDTLLEQWIEEIKLKLEKPRQKGDVIMIKTAANLDKYSISEFKDAQIIVVNRTVLGLDSYANRLANFVGMPGPTTSSGRAFSQWLKHASHDISHNVGILENQGVKKLKAHVTEVFGERLNSEAFNASVPSRRFKGQAYVDNKKKSGAPTPAKAKVHTLETKNIDKPLFQMFRFNRIIVDEFHQYDAREYAAIADLKADKRWGLSGTPSMGDFYDVARMASLLSVPLPIGSDARGIMRVSNIRALRTDMTNFERFDAMRHRPSENMHKRLQEIDQSFLDHFVRQNIMDFGDLPCQEHLLPVQLDLKHHAFYHEVSQHLNSLGMRLKKSSKSKAASHRQKGLNEATKESEGAEEALSKAAAFSLVRQSEDASLIRKDEAAELRSILPWYLDQARKHERKTFDEWRVSQLDSKQLGDAATIEQVKKAFSSAVIEPPNPQDREFKEGSRARTAALNGVCNRLLVANRSARYLQNVERLVSSGRKGKSAHAVLSCVNPQCDSRSIDVMAVSGHCGHAICKGCHETRSERSIHKCPSDGCAAAMHEYYLLWSDQVSTSARETDHGTKAEAVLNLLSKIEGSGDQAIVFVQFQDQLDQVKKALKASRISASVVQDPALAATQIKQFRDSAGTKDQTTAIVLNASSETAAGSNIQNANHVIFFSPLLRDNQYEYSATMAQAIGRARRHGQKKTIHVYRVFALHTIDVDILEHREKRIDALVEQGAEAIMPPGGTAKITRPERTQLVRENGKFSLRPQSWLVEAGDQEERGGIVETAEKVRGKGRVLGWEDFSSLVKFSKTFTENDD